MTSHENERYIYQKDDPELFEQIENLVFANEIEVEVDGERYNVARGDDDAQGSYYVLTPKG